MGWGEGDSGARSPRPQGGWDRAGNGVPANRWHRSRQASARVNHRGLRSVRGGAQRVELSRDGLPPRRERLALRPGGRAGIRGAFPGRPLLPAFGQARTEHSVPCTLSFLDCLGGVHVQGRVARRDRLYNTALP